MQPSSPIPLLQFSGAERTYRISQQALEAFQTIPAEAPISIVSILGKYRTGKSFILNKIIPQGSFLVGNTINSCTKGLWMYLMPKKLFLEHLLGKRKLENLLKSNESQDSGYMIIIDSEGYGGVDESASHDSRVFILTLLISSCLLYNSVGTIDENALNNISVVIRLSNEIQEKSENSVQFPALLWLLRDFVLKLEDKSGKGMSAKDYLEGALELQKGVSDGVEKKNKIRRMFKHFFGDRDCLALVRPAETEEEICKLGRLFSLGRRRRRRRRRELKQMKRRNRLSLPPPDTPEGPHFGCTA